MRTIAYLRTVALPLYCWKTFISGVVHCDLNSLNIIGEKKDDKNVEFKAIIDFGDVCGSAFMFDLAICLIYMMVAAKVQNGDYYNIATQVYLGYISARSLRYFVCMNSHIH